MIQEIKYRDFSRYRNELFGLAIISVILLHYFDLVVSAQYIARPWRILAKTYNSVVGSVGVEVFVFYSGFGITYSLNRKPTLSTFYRKRFERVGIPYLVMGGIFWIIKDLMIRKVSFGTFLYDYSLLSFWIDGVAIFWYIAFICVMYAITPFLFHGLEEKRYLIFSVAAVVFSVLFYFAAPKVFSNIEIAVLRIPIYFLGMYFAVRSIKGDTIDVKLLALLILSIPLKLLVGVKELPFDRLVNGFYALLFVNIYILLRKMILKKENVLFHYLESVGAYTLELYITHIAFRNLMRAMKMNLANPALYGLCILLSVVASVTFSKLYSKWKMRLSERKTRL